MRGNNFAIGVISDTDDWHNPLPSQDKLTFKCVQLNNQFIIFHSIVDFTVIWVQVYLSLANKSINKSSNVKFVDLWNNT